MRQLGWVVPERYCRPWMAASPIDFWRRWNTYVRSWLEAYVFVPLARRMARRTQSRWSYVVAAVATLAASGILHDAFVFADRQELSGSRTKFFLGAGAVLLVWRAAGSIWARAGRRWGALRGAPSQIGSRLVARLGFVGLMLIAARVWRG
jgi:hypothetical protein